MADKIFYNYSSDTQRKVSRESLKEEQPAYEKKYEGEEIVLTKDFEGVVTNNDLLNVLENRKSVRAYKNEKITMEELGYILWYTYGVKAVLGTKRKATMRTVPSAGARHTLELYFIANDVCGLKNGLYHYNGVSHSIVMIKELADSRSEAENIAAGQEFVGEANVLFIWTCTPDRVEWRYPDTAVKYALIDAGHACQNLYIASAGIDCGVCAIGAYYQDRADELLGVDSEKEMTIYMAAMGKMEK